MSTPAIIRKLTKELEDGITSEVQVVYLLAGIRKLMERDGIKSQYPYLTFHCDWVLHSELQGKTAQDILRKFDAAHPLLRDHNVELHDLPGDLRTEIDTISKMSSFEKELSSVLTKYGLPPLTATRQDGWPLFLHFYANVIEDIPLLVQDTVANPAQNISKVVVNVREAVLNADMLFQVTWTIYDKNGQSGTIFVINSFEHE
jgi:hypothetical protein